MPIATKENIAEWFGPYFKHEGLDTNECAEEIFNLISSRKLDETFERTNELINAHGTEAIRAEDYHVNNYFGDIVAEYINVGEMYSATLFYETESGAFLVTTWADWMEAAQSKYKNLKQC